MKRETAFRDAKPYRRLLCMLFSAAVCLAGGYLAAQETEEPAAPQPAAPAAGAEEPAAPAAGAEEPAAPAAGAEEPAAPAAGPEEPAAGAEGAGGIGAAPAPGAGQAAAGEAPAAEGTTTILPQAERFRGVRVDIDQGEIPVLEFLRFLADYTGLPVLVDNSQGNVLESANVRITAPIEDADADLVKAILETNRFLVLQEVLPSGKEVIRVESAQQQVTGAGEPTQNPVIRVDDKGNAEIFETEISEGIDLRPDELATMVFTLKYTQPTDAITALNSLVSGQKTAGRSRAFSIVDVKNSMMVIITAKFGLLDYLRKLLTIIDVPILEPERIVQIIEVENSDAEELVQIIEQFLQGRTGTTSRRVAAPAQPGAPGQPAPARSGTGETTYETSLIADYRTQKIIIETYSQSDLDDINMLINELDVRFDYRRLRTHIYQVRYLKADEVAIDIQSLIGGAGTGLSGRAGLGTRGGMTSRTGGIPRRGQTRTPAATQPTATVPGAAGGQPGTVPALIVPHIATNSLLIQAEEEEYAEILNILGEIDVKRRQVFLEAALVQVSTGSTLNYTIELLAGDPDDNATRALFETSFGLSGIDLENFNRTLPDISAPDAVPPGAFLAIMNRGKFPALVSFFKTNTDSQVLATPFILADDNMPNIIEILETRFVQLTNTVNTTTTTSQEAEEAGITLEITPTISSESAVFLELGLSVSEFQGSGTAQVLPPKTENRITSAVTIPDGDIFVIGGLTRENRSKSVSKVPILGDIPFLGKLFRSESTSKNASNLYIFLRAHILTHPDFDDGDDLTAQGLEKVHEFAPDLQPTNFDKPDVPEPPRPAPDLDAPTRTYLSPGEERTEAPRGPYRPRPRMDEPDAERGYRETYGQPPAGEAAEESPQPAVAGEPPPAPPPAEAPALEPPAAAPPAGAAAEPGEKPGPDPMDRLLDEARGTLPRALEEKGIEIDTGSESWLIPLKDSPTSQSRKPPKRPNRRARTEKDMERLLGSRPGVE